MDHGPVVAEQSFRIGLRFAMTAMAIALAAAVLFFATNDPASMPPMPLLVILLVAGFATIVWSFAAWPATGISVYVDGIEVKSLRGDRFVEWSGVKALTLGSMGNPLFGTKRCIFVIVFTDGTRMRMPPKVMVREDEVRPVADAIVERARLSWAGSTTDRIRSAART